MHVHVHLPKIIRLSTDLAISAAHQAERCLNRFFHHVPDLSGKRDVSLAWITGRFDVQYLATLRCVSESRDHARFAGLEFRFANVFRRTKHFSDNLGCDRDVLGFSARHLGRDATTNRADLPFEFAYAGFVRVIVDDPPKRVLLKFALLLLESVLLQLTRNKVALCDLKFLALG